MRPKYVSNAGVFAKMGNPWLSLRDQMSDFGRNPSSETPDIDRYLHAKKAEEKPSEVKRVKPKKGKSALADHSTKAMNIRRAAMRDIVSAERGRVIRVK